MSADVTAAEVVQSLTGFDEIAIEKAFGVAVEGMATEAALLRALAFVVEKRAGKNDAEAKKAALSLSRKDVEGYFTAAEDEPMPEEPVTASGKG